MPLFSTFSPPALLRRMIIVIIFVLNYKTTSLQLLIQFKSLACFVQMLNLVCLCYSKVMAFTMYHQKNLHPK